MTFFSGNTDMNALLNKIADELIATGAWLDADLAISGSKRVVKHAVDANFYVHFERKVTPGGNAEQHTYNRLNEIKVTISSDFNTVTHLPAGTIQVSSIPAEWFQYATPSYPHYYANDQGNGNKAGQYWLWVDTSGFTLLVTWLASTAYDYTSFFHLERNTTKEYADGFSNFFLVAMVNEDRDLYYSVSGKVFSNRAGYADYYRASYARPFNQVAYDQAQGVAHFFDAYKSNGNAKVYFQFPYYSNNLDPLRRIPIAQTRAWFRLGLAQGVADGDLIDWVNGSELWKYLAKTVQSPDSTSYLSIAFRYA